MTNPLRSEHLGWGAGMLVLALLAWQGHHVAHWLPEIEQEIEKLGVWGPVALVLAIVVLGPFLVPDSIFGIAAGATLGLVRGTAYYFAGLYAMCLVIQVISAHLLRARVLRLLASRPKILAAVEAAARGGVQLPFLIRLVPINQALVSYGFGAADVPLRSALVGNVAMVTT